MEFISFESIDKQERKKQVDVIKVKTDRWVNSRGELVIQKTIRQMRRLSSSPNDYLAFEDELSQMGADVVDSSLKGVDMLADGLYRMHVTYQGYDCETGIVDEVELGFTPMESRND